MSNNTINVLYVDDEVSNLETFRANFRKVYNIFTVESAKDGLEILSKEKIHVIVSDQKMPGTTGTEFFESILEKYPEPIRIILTGYAEIGSIMDAINKGQVYRYILKPFNATEIKLVIDKSFEVYTLREQNRILLADLAKANLELEQSNEQLAKVNAELEETNKKLEKVNSQLEFYLRDKLTS